MSDDYFEKLFTVVNEGVSLGILFNTPEANAARNKLNNKLACHPDDYDLVHLVHLETELRNHLQKFGNEREVFVSASHPLKSKFDIIFLFTSITLAKEYLSLARDDFPNYSFVYVNDPAENSLKNKNYKLI